MDLARQLSNPPELPPANPALVRALHTLPKNQAFVPLGNVTTFGKVTTRPCQG